MPTSLVAAVRARQTDLFDDILAAWDEGAAILPLDPRLPTEQIDRVIELCRPARFVSDEGDRTLRATEPVSEGTAAVLLTSGSTGEPKAVELSHRAFETAAALVHERIGARAGDRWLCCVPLFHVAGFAMIARSAALGTQLEVHDGFDPDAVAASAADLVSLVPTQLRRLLDAGADIARFDRILLGGSAIPGRLIEEAADAGGKIIRTYGMTETCGGVVYDGTPLREVAVRTDPDGVIEISSPTLMTGYRRATDLTAERLAEGWFRTDDLGRIENGSLVVVGRVDDKIISGGEKISPAEVRRALLEHPGVEEAVVVGVPDIEWGEAVGAVVTGEVIEDDLLAWLRDRLARHQVPKVINVLSEIPQTPMGKPDKNVIREILARDASS